jgi:hypothetical protein
MFFKRRKILVKHPTMNCYSYHWVKKFDCQKVLSLLLTVLLMIQLVGGIFLLVPRPKQTQAATQNWPFTTASNYIYDNAKIEISSGQAQLEATSTPDWYNTNWGYRRAITIDNTGNAINLTNYQVQSTLNSSNFDFTKAHTHGEAIRFTASDGTTLIQYWIESYDSSGQTATIWPKIPNISASSTKTIYTYYGNSASIDPYDYIRLFVDSTTHNDYGLTYPVTYEFSIPSDSSNLKVYKRYSETQSWTQITEKTSSDFYNGIEAVRFDYSNNIAYISVAFDDSSDEIHLKITDASDQIVDISFQGISKYYDNREAAVVVTGDDWEPAHEDDFQTACDIFRSASIWFSAGIITRKLQGNHPIWTNIQNKIDAGYVEPVSHSRTHPDIPYSDYDSEIGGSRDDLINNLDFPVLNKKGAQEYVYCWIEPNGASDSTVRSKLGEYKYLVDRNTSRDDRFATSDSSNGLYNRIGFSYNLDNGNLTDANNKFDAVIATRGIYHIYMHPYNVDWTDGSWERQHIDYIKEKTNLWYVGFGHLYLYHHIDDQNLVSVD